MKPIVPKELTYTALSSKSVVFYFHGQVIWRDDLDKTEDVKKAGDAGLKCILEGNGYDHARRNIREIAEGCKFPLVYFDFNSYVRDWPEAERSREWLTRGNRPVFIFQSSGHFNCLPGGYLWMYISPPGFGDTEFRICINDNDDGGCCKDLPTKEEAQTALQEVLALVPINTFELTKLLNFKN